MPNLDDNTKEILEKIFLDEIGKLQDQITKYDRYSLAIKGWAITLWSVLIIYAVREYTHESIIFGIVGVVMFWLFDALYKFYQRGPVTRSKELQLFLKDFHIHNENNKIEIVQTEQKNSKTSIDIINIYNPIGVFSNEEIKACQNIFRCLFLRVICVIYMILIGISLLILSNFQPNIVVFSFGLTFIIMAIILYFIGVDKTFDNKTLDYLLLEFFFIIYFHIYLIGYLISL